MTNKDMIIIADYSESDAMSFDELCARLGISSEVMRELMDYEIISASNSVENRLFDAMELRRIKTALRLQRDLEVNVAGVIIILDLLEEMKNLRAKTSLIERHLLRSDEEK